MTFTTLQYGSVERTLADWGASICQRQVSNQAGDHLTLEVPMPADGNDLFPYDAQIILRIGRVTTSVNPTNPSFPPSGATAFTGGTIAFIGYRGKARRAGSGNLEKIQYPFLGMWERFLMRTIFQKLQASYNGTENIADWLDEVILGLSLNALTGAADTIPGTDATNLMSITQTLKEIAAWAIMRATALKGAQPFQFADLAANESTGNYLLNANPAAPLLLPDFVPGYGGSGYDSNSANQASALPFGGALVNVSLRAPLDGVKSMSCGECLRKMARWAGPIGDIVMWFDNTTTLANNPCPTLNIASRDQLPSVSLPYPNPNPNLNLNPQCEVTDIARLDELIPPAVDLKFVMSGVWNASSYKQTVHDIAATINGEVIEGIGLAGALYTAASFGTNSPQYVGGSPNSALMQALEAAALLPDAVTVTVDMQGAQGTLDTCTFTAIDVDIGTPAGDSRALAFWKYLFPELADITNPDFFAGSTVTVVDDSGGAIDTTHFAYLLTGNMAGAKWMLAGNATGGAACQTVRAHITATFTGTENNNTVPTGHILNQPKHATPTLITLQGGTYSRQNVAPGEIAPLGLAGFMYNLLKIPHYEGSYTIQEQEITDQCPIGSTLNLTGGRAEWATMNACVQEVNYDYLAGKTVIKFNAGSHLGVTDLASRVRANRGPRWLYSMPINNLTNDPSVQPGTQFGTDVAGKSPSPGPRAADFIFHPSDINDAKTNLTDYTTGFPGITHDASTSGQPDYGGIAAPNAPVQFLATGSSGNIDTFARLDAAAALILQDQTKTPTLTIKIDLSDLPGGFSTNSSGNYVVKLREVTDCAGGTTVYRQALVSEPYASPLGNT